MVRNLFISRSHFNSAGWSLLVGDPALIPCHGGRIKMEWYLARSCAMRWPHTLWTSVRVESVRRLCLAPSLAPLSRTLSHVKHNHRSAASCCGGDELTRLPRRLSRPGCCYHQRHPRARRLRRQRYALFSRALRQDQSTLHASVLRWLLGSRRVW